ncbi:MAG TPA: FtsX-like permease family protein [Candidatus Limnocylindrales bacterium]|jgi:putative ABC transport system permease protein|nr:FtsX-like permease family protein [Candidatus Limnocylindrales bacterium]
MKSYDLFELAVRNLRQSKLRNGLTTVGISVGVASLVAMLSLGVGLQQLATRRLAGSGMFDTVFVTSRQDFRGFDREDDQKAPHPEQALVLDESARVKMTKLPDVTEVEPEIRVMGEVVSGGETHFGFVTGLPMSARENEAFDTLKGKFFSSDDADEAILLLGFAKELNPKNPSELIGQDISLRYGERQALSQDASDRPQLSGDDTKANPAGANGDDFGFSVVRKIQKLRVVGLIDQEPYGGMRTVSRGRIFLPVATTERLNMAQFTDMRSSLSGGGGKTYTTLTVRVKDPAKVQGVQDAISQMGFRTFSVLDATKSLRRFFTVLDLFLGIFGSLALAVATLAIINTLVMAVLERRREIGVMKAIGASDGDVKKLFFTEAGAMGFFGGVLGIALGFAIGKAINLGTGIYLKQHQLPAEPVWIMPVWLIGAAIAFSIVVSLLAGLYPASRAAKLDPVQTLKYE